jgi:hypothetical protein
MTNSMAATLETRPRTGDSITMRPEPPVSDSPAYWQALCSWLTNQVQGISVSIERRDGKLARLESHFHPLQSISTHLTPNGVRTIAMTVRTSGHLRAFEVAGPDAVTVKWNPAGRLTRIEIHNQEGAMVLHFSVPLPAQPSASSNAWGE